MIPEATDGLYIELGLGRDAGGGFPLRRWNGIDWAGSEEWDDRKRCAENDNTGV